MLGLGGWHGGERDFTSLCNASTGRGSPDFFDWWVSVRQCQPKSYCIHQKVSICLAEKHSVFQATSCMRQPWLKGMDRKEKSPGKKDRQRNWSNITCKGNFPHQNLSFSLFICPHTLSTKIGKEASIPRALLFQASHQKSELCLSTLQDVSCFWLHLEVLGQQKSPASLEEQCRDSKLLLPCANLCKSDIFLPEPETWLVFHMDLV